MFVRLGLLHYCPVFAGTKLTNPILCETEKRKNAKTLGVTRFQKPAVVKLNLPPIPRQTAGRLSQEKDIGFKKYYIFG